MSLIVAIVAEQVLLGLKVVVLF
ncbi:rCG25542 [Rattus norvegicus]|uniref:RCG25542 n=1 Tax=Rattus norvegicus TaxID=10116 RepID=A6I224_RAT|nr:rCG25542 [Rattus norvegicus]